LFYLGILADIGQGVQLSRSAGWRVAPIGAQTYCGAGQG
jgi:hypothetical protein